MAYLCKKYNILNILELFLIKSKTKYLRRIEHTTFKVFNLVLNIRQSKNVTINNY